MSLILLKKKKKKKKLKYGNIKDIRLMHRSNRSFAYIDYETSVELQFFFFIIIIIIYIFLIII